MMINDDQGVYGITYRLNRKSRPAFSSPVMAESWQQMTSTMARSSQHGTLETPSAQQNEGCLATFLLAVLLAILAVLFTAIWLLLLILLRQIRVRSLLLHCGLGEHNIALADFPFHCRLITYKREKLNHTQSCRCSILINSLVGSCWCSIS